MTEFAFIGQVELCPALPAPQHSSHLRGDGERTDQRAKKLASVGRGVLQLSPREGGGNVEGSIPQSFLELHLLSLATENRQKHQYVHCLVGSGEVV